MLNSGKKNCALRDKKINILTLVWQHTKKFEDTKGQIRSHVVQRMVDNTMGIIGQKDNGQQNKYSWITA
jgi:hypothetical protein